MDVSHCITDDIKTCNKTCNNAIIGMKSAYLCFNDFPLFSNVFIYIHEYANYANTIICIFDHGMKALRLTFNMVPIK